MPDEDATDATGGGPPPPTPPPPAGRGSQEGETKKEDGGPHSGFIPKDGPSREPNGRFVKGCPGGPGRPRGPWVPFGTLARAELVRPVTEADAATRKDLAAVGVDVDDPGTTIGQALVRATIRGAARGAAIGKAAILRELNMRADGLPGGPRLAQRLPEPEIPDSPDKTIEQYRMESLSRWRRIADDSNATAALVAEAQRRIDAIVGIAVEADDINRRTPEQSARDVIDELDRIEAATGVDESSDDDDDDKKDDDD